MENQQAISSSITFNDWSENNMQSPTEFELSGVLSAKASILYNELASCLVNDNPSELSPTSVNLTEKEMHGSSTMENQAAAAASSDRAAGFLDCKFSNLPIQAAVANKINFSDVCLLDHKISLPVIDHYSNNCRLMDDPPLLSNGSIDMENNHLPDTAYHIEKPGLDSNGDLFCLRNQADQVPNHTQTYLSDSNNFLRSSSFSDELCFGLESMLNNPDTAPNKSDPNVNIVMSNNLNIDTVPAYSPSLFFNSINPSMDSQNQAHLSTKNQQYESHGPNLHGSHLFGSNGCFPVVSHEACIPITTPTPISDLNSSFGGESRNTNFLSDSATIPLFNSYSSVPRQDLPNLGGTDQFNENASFTITSQQYPNGPCGSNVNHQLAQLPSFNFTTQDQQCLNDPGASNANDQLPYMMSTIITTEQQQYSVDPSASNVNHQLAQLPGFNFTTQDQQCSNDPGASNAKDQLPYMMSTIITTEQQYYSIDPCASNVNHQLPQLPSYNFTTQDQQCSNHPGASNANDQLPYVMSTNTTTGHSIDPSASNANHQFPQLFGSNGVYPFTPGSMITEQVPQELIHSSSYSSWLKGNVLLKTKGHSSLEINPKSYACKACNKSFPSTHALGGHMSSHTRAKRKEQKITRALSNLSQKDFDFIYTLTCQMASFAKKNNPDVLMPQVSTMTENLLKVASGKRKLSLECGDGGDEEGSSRKIVKLGETEGSGEELK